MGLPNLLSPPPGEHGWEEFWWNNWIDHQDIQQLVQADDSINNTVYVIIPWTDQDRNFLMQKHQEFHDDMNNALGLQGQDLTSFNPKDEDSKRYWLWNHYLEHQAAHMALGF